MGSETRIGWTDKTANFWFGCEKISPGCKHCYAEVLVTGRMGLKVWGPAKTTERVRAKGVWKDVLTWEKEAVEAKTTFRVFAQSLSDTFEDHPMVAPWRMDALLLMERCSHLHWQVLTKRPENIRAMVPPAWLKHWPAHVWVGTTVEDQRRAEERIPHLLDVPARVRFLSCEPLLEAVDLARVAVRRFPGAIPASVEIDALRGFCGATKADDTPAARGLQWVIVGGESGGSRTQLEMPWVEGLVNQCQMAGVPVFVKQDSAWQAGTQGRIPDALWIKQFPKVA